MTLSDLLLLDLQALCLSCLWDLLLSNGEGPCLFPSDLGKELRSVERASCAAGVDAVLFPTCLVHGEALLSQSEGSTQ